MGRKKGLAKLLNPTLMNLMSCPEKEAWSNLTLMTQVFDFHHAKKKTLAALGQLRSAARPSGAKSADSALLAAAGWIASSSRSFSRAAIWPFI